MRTLQQRLVNDTRYVMVGFPAAVIAFALVVAGVAAGLGTLVVFAGLPILAMTALAARGFADVERAMLPDILGRGLERPEYTRVPEGAGTLRRVLNPLFSGQAWADLLHAILMLPFAIFSFTITVVWWVGAIVGLTFPLYGWVLAKMPAIVDGGLPRLLGFGDDPGLFMVFNTAVGVLFALSLLPVVRLAALSRASISQVLLTRTAYPVRRSSSAIAV